VKCVVKENVCKNVNDSLFLGYGFYEVQKAKRDINFDLPVNIRFFVSNRAKPKMLEFYYVSFDEFVSRKDYCYAAMDTDSAYLCISAS